MRSLGNVSPITETVSNVPMPPNTGYVVDGAFMPSIGAVNPALTIKANALRVGDHLLERLG